MRRRMIKETDIISVNLHNYDTDIADIYIDNGIEKTYSNWNATDFIPVYEGQYLVTSNDGDANYVTGNKYNYMYDENKKVITNGGFNVSVNKGLTDTIVYIPSNVKYIRLSCTAEIINKLEIYRLEE